MPCVARSLRFRHVVPGLILAGCIAGVASPAARAASPACTLDADCAAPQICDLDLDVCAWEALDRDTLIAAITGANADVERDVIVVGAANPNGAPERLEIHLDTPAVENGQLGPIALPIISSAITIRGESADLSIIDIDADVRLFVLARNEVTNFRPDLLLQRLTLRDARPGPNGTGAIVGGGAVHVTATPTTAVAPALPELPVLAAEDVRFTSGSGHEAGAVSNEGAPARFLRCTFDENEGPGGAGALRSTTGASLTQVTFADNRGLVGALELPNATRLDEAGATVDVTLTLAASRFERNRGELNGAVRSLAITTINNGIFLDNTAEGDDAEGGAVAARSLRLQGGLYERNFARGGGGAVSLLDGGPDGGVDDPVSAPALIAAAAFNRNETRGRGGAVLAAGIPLTVSGASFSENVARTGGAVAVETPAERNGAAPDVSVRDSVFFSNFARATATLAAVDTTADELGPDTGSIELRLSGRGSALSLDGVSDGLATNNCFLGNSADAVVATTASAVNARSNWWGDAGGAGPAGPGDSVLATGATLDVTSPLAAVPDFCGDLPRLYTRVFVGATLTVDSALIVDDFRLTDAARGIQVLNAADGDLVPDMRLGLLRILVEGVNDAEVEGNESFAMNLEDCGDPCLYDRSGGPVTVTISDNGDGGEGEGEGEGEPECVEDIAVSPASLLLPSTGASREATLTITNNSACDVRLLRPFLQSGASQGFAVLPVLQDKLALVQGASLDVVVTFTPVQDDAPTEPPVGNLRIESQGGSVLDVPLALEGGCACASSKRGAPAEGLLALVAGLVLVRRGARCRRR